MEEYVQLYVEDERSGRTLQLSLTNHEVERAKIDSQFLQHLLDKVYEKEAELLSERNELSERNDLSERNEFWRDFANDEELQDNNNESTTQKSLFIWNDACIFLLLTLYEDHQDEFKYKRHKIVFDKIALQMKEKNYIVNGSQCQSKLNSLKKMYRKIIDHNNTSGNDRASWPYFDRMNQLFGATGWANPVSLASESGPAEVAIESPNPKKDMKRKKDNESKEYYNEKLKLRKNHYEKVIEQCERHHQEKMELLKQILTKK